jgi:hypothetical protein
MKKRINSRSKGNRFERAIANDIRRWLGVECKCCEGRGIDDPLWRYPEDCPDCDGKGYTSDYEVTRNEPSYQAGRDGRAGEFNIFGPTPHRLCWELKSGYDFDERHLFKRPLPKYLCDFWSQADRQAASVGKHPILLCKRDRGPTIVFLREATSRALTVCGGSEADVMEVEVATTTLEWERLRVWLWSDLLLVDSLALSAL